MGGSVVGDALVLERSKRQLDGNHLGGDAIDPVAVPHGIGIGGVELVAQVLVLAVQLLQLHGFGSSEGRDAVMQHYGKPRAARAITALDPNCLAAVPLIWSGQTHIRWRQAEMSNR